MSGVDDRIVVNDYHAVTCRMHIELDSVGAELDRALESSDRILGMTLVGTPVGDALRGVTAAAWGQVALSVVAFCSMSAKDMSAGVQGQSALTAGGPERLPDEAP